MPARRRSGRANDRRAYNYVSYQTILASLTPEPLPTYTVTYNGNTNTSGSVPVDSSSPYLDGSNVKVLGNTGTLAKIGYKFIGWNTQANGFGRSYLSGQQFTIFTADITLYAQWTIAFTVTYDKNASAASGSIIDQSSPYLPGSTVTVLSSTGFVNTGNKFDGWNSQANGLGSTYTIGSTFSILADTTLYATWSPVFTVTYDKNASAATGSIIDPSSPYIPGSTVTVLPSTDFTNMGNIFNSWNSQANGLGSTYTIGSTFTINSNTTIYAKWTQIFTVTYQANGSTNGTVPTDTNSPYIANTTVTVLTNSGTLVKTGNTFDGWNSQVNGSGTPYATGSTFQITSNTILYAKWNVNNYTVTYQANGSTTGTAPSSQTAPYNTSVTLRTNSGTLFKTNNVFDGWNTQADGLGLSYATGVSFTIPDSNTTLYAKWTPTYTVTYTPNSGSGNVPTDSTPYTSGTSVTVLGNTGTPPILTRSGFNFTGWTISGGTGTVYNNPDTFVITTNTTLVANWTLSYTLTYGANGGSGNVPTDTTRYIAGASVTLLGNIGTPVILTKANNIFDGWNTRADGLGTSYAVGSQFPMPGGNTTIYAKWTPIYTMTYSNNSTNYPGVTGTITDTSSPYIAGSSVTVKSSDGFTSANYIFNSWNSQPNGLGALYTIGQVFSINASTTLYAKWTAIYTFKYDSNGATTGTVPTTTIFQYDAGTTVTVLENTGNLAIPIPAGPGAPSYIFNGWNTADNGGGTTYIPPTQFNITQNTTLYVRWKALYTFTYDGNENTDGTIPIDSLSPYAVGSQVIIMANTGNLSRTGYTFSNWAYFADGGGNTAPLPGAIFIMPAKNTIFYAKWTINTYSVTYDANGSTNGTAPSSQTAPYNTTVALQTNSGNLIKTDNVFDGWNTQADGLGTSYAVGTPFVIPVGNTTLYAKWTPNYTVTYTAPDATGGTVPINNNRYTAGTQVTVSTNSGNLIRTNYTFNGWTIGGTGTVYTNPQTFTMLVGGTTLVANWTSTYTVSYAANAVDASGNPPGDQTVAYNSSVTISGNTGTPNPLTRNGYAFTTWNTQTDGLGTSYSFGNSFAFNANTTLYANWKQTFTMSYSNNSITYPNATGTITDTSSPYITGSTVTVKPSTGFENTGYSFSSWNTVPSGSGGTSYASDATFTITGNTTLYAQWTINNYTVTYASNSGTGDVPSDTNTYNYNNEVTVRGNTGTPTPLTRTNFTFAGWNTVSDITTGLGTLYTTGNKFIMPAANTTLYAQWNAYSSLTFDNNGGGGGSTTTQYAPGTTVNFSPTEPAKSGNYSFAGWNTIINGTGKYYALSGTITIYNESITLYAQWRFDGNDPTNTVTYYANQGQGNPPQPVGSLKEFTAFTVSNQGGLTRGGFAFIGWNTQSDGTGDYYGPGGTGVAPNVGFNMIPYDVALEAQWATGSSTYTLTYDGNLSTGGSVPANPITYNSGTNVGVLNNNNSLVRTGYSFLGWNTAANGTGTNYLVNNPYQNYSPIVMLSNTTLFAQWVAGNVFEYSGSYQGFSRGLNEQDLSSLYYLSTVTSYRSPTNNTFTIIIPTYYNKFYAEPYGTGNGPTITGIGKLISTYAQATISQITSGLNQGSYQITATYITKGTSGSQTQTATLLLGPTYWPTTETISSVTIPTNASQPAAFSFGISPPVNVPAGGYYNQLVRPLNNDQCQCAAVQAFYINFSNGSTTRVAFGSNPYINPTSTSVVSNYARIEVANGPTPNPITGTFSPTNSTDANTG